MWLSNPTTRHLAGAAAKLLQPCLTLCNPIDGSPQGSTIPGILQARTLEWVAISFSNTWKWKSESEVTQSCLTLCHPMDCRLPGSSVHGIFQARVLEWLAIAFSTTRHTPRGKHNSKRHMHRNTHCNTIYNSQNMETTWMSTNRRMDKDVVFCILCVYIYIHNRMLFSRKKWNWVTCRGVDGPREFQTKWSKSEKDKY